ncbi:MAG: two-component system C4-dicarboxylate transport response regulator DctD [Candidatus Endobugula sp.]|jgi:two-component system C4-dicarboxylate transport response regulator DctD
MNKDDISIILIDDDKDIRISTADLLSTHFKKIESYSSPKSVLPRVSTEFPAVIVTDLRMPNDDGLEFASAANRIDPHLPIILMTGYGDISTAVDAMKHGIYDFIEKPVDSERLISALERAIEKRRATLSLSTTKEKSTAQSALDQSIIGYSATMKAIKKNILDFSSMSIPLVIYGNTGTGKELVAHCLHDYSERREAPFILLNCAAIPEELIETELFGYTRGASSNATSLHRGKLEQAKEGTIFLDEIDSLPVKVQAKLLLALENKVITPVGSNVQIPIYCRIISATKEELRGSNHFRQDLFFSLQVAEIRLPDLKSREEDVIALFNHFSMLQCDHLKTQYQPLTDEAQKKLITYEWPGNVRELINVAIRYALTNCTDIDHALHNDELDDFYRHENQSLKEQVEAYEELLIKLKLREHKGKVAKVLDDLHIERRTFNQKLNRYGINTGDYKERDT